MARYETADIRNLALIGHSHSGKTSLAEAFLFKTKATARLGRIEDGTSVFDFEPEEKERKITIDMAAAVLRYGGKEIHLLDTPGYSDFCGEAISALHAVETAAVCVHASAGILVNTRKMWDRAGERSVARAIFVNKVDSDNVELRGLLGQIRETFGRECVPVTLPTGAGDSVTAVVDLLSGGAVPAELQELAAESREKLMEIDDALLEKYLEGGTVAPEEVAKALPKAIAERRIVPILCTSAEKDVGVAEALDFLARYLPSPALAGPREGEDPEKKSPVKRDSASTAPFSGQVFKAVADPFVGRLCYVRVFSGSIGSDQPVFNQRTGRSARMGKLYKPFGREERPGSPAIAGDIVCITKVDDLQLGDTVCDEKALIRYPVPKYPTPMVSLAVEPKSKQDLVRLSESLTKMADSDPTFRFTRERKTAELVISGMSQLHIDVVISRLKRKFEVGLNTKTPKIAFQETILGSSEGHHKHKKQTGGHGQYGEVYLRVKPTERGSGFTFTDSISQGRIPQQYIPAIEKGVRETLERGVLAGYPVVDLEVEVFDGSYHDVDSSPASFQLAGSKAFKKAFLAAKPALLEPVVNIEITVPSKFMGDITGDLNSRRGRIQGMDTQGNLQIVRALIPYMEITNYETQLRSVTGGEGSYSIEPSHYDALPHKILEAVVAQSKMAEEEDED